ncbi:MotA/TolQ/ExbB proton channel family protein [Acaryochloris sp. 'Moss Beach']|uniref:MotA/TolQ/ExbB proton channel family protein n=1 Tax=Acaryochloris sp. 'Moss Beach' TaxID=2740837 RepID=UPI001F4393C1|nr:MotA/TolQ/ExbB proton channel family protein [Acaryochloris sp. 'Moss Beach']UJB67760.1 MotA/TolQ/ExbB proton channel family protein [Acaryochloris sp. 'Moss Beach']
MQFGQVITAGGVVMLPLMVFSLIAIALIIERLTFWTRLNRNQVRIVKQALRLYRQDNIYDALGYLQEQAKFPIARIFLAALSLEDPTPEEFRLALESEAQAELPTLKRFTTVFDTIISISPLLGLLGTVLGLINSFSSLDMGNIGGSETAGVTGGISTALISTAAGLIVAISTLIFANAFRSLYQRQLAFIQEYGGQLELLYRHRYERGGVTHALTR